MSLGTKPNLKTGNIEEVARVRPRSKSRRSVALLIVTPPDNHVTLSESTSAPGRDSGHRKTSCRNKLNLAPLKNLGYSELPYKVLPRVISTFVECPSVSGDVPCLFDKPIGLRQGGAGATLTPNLSSEAKVASQSLIRPAPATDRSNVSTSADPRPSDCPAVN
ncbi:hypothetical protein RRG08_055246 [Elysia crispata]|uniref:Uncharacterized protein n=1 Tax=Elysia crispata TaxID=231223 RepID=A0AAE0XUM6_9GAST|nr:hypothetical protein RRG08_055246 [Elysia crispata]